MKKGIIPEIFKRRSIFSFSDKPVEEEKIRLLFEAARWAPSSMNLQPWRFIYASKGDPYAYQRIYDLLNDDNKVWAGSAPLLIVCVAEIIMEYKSRPNRFAFHDLGIGVGNLLLQATSMGLYVHPMGGFFIEKARADLNIPERFEPVTIMAIGYNGDIEKLPEKLKSREIKKRERREIKDFISKGLWGN